MDISNIFSYIIDTKSVKGDLVKSKGSSAGTTLKVILCSVILNDLMR
jgi:hypothetical protein